MIKSKPSFIKRLTAGILAVAIIFTMSPVIAMAGEAVDLEWYNFEIMRRITASSIKLRQTAPIRLP